MKIKQRIQEHIQTHTKLKTRKTYFKSKKEQNNN